VQFACGTVQQSLLGSVNYPIGSNNLSPKTPRRKAFIMQTHTPTTSQGGNSRTGHLMQDAREVVTHPIESCPISTSLLVFGAGLGIGALIGSMIAEASSAPPSRMSQAEDVGRSILNSLSAALPDSLARHMHK
jgi:hypothetical protein